MHIGFKTLIKDTLFDPHFYVLGENTVQSSIISISSTSITKYCKGGFLWSAERRNSEMKMRNGTILCLCLLNKGKSHFHKVEAMAETFLEKMAPSWVAIHS